MESIKYFVTLNLFNTKILIPKQNFIRKLVTFTITENAEKVRNALFEAGAGNIGNYEDCSFSSKGIGTYMGNENSDPQLGARFVRETAEIKIEVTFEKHLESKILKALFSNHVYEEVAYEIYELQNTHQNVGLGMVGEFETPMEEHDFLALVKNASRWNTTFSAWKTDKKMAVLGGSGSYAIKKCNYGWC
jgi:hypothetical protein